MKSAETSNPADWPPKSPFEAFLGSPNGRRKLRERAGASVSPLKRSSTAPNLRLGKDNDDRISAGEEEDEETLQLQLAAIEAKLKLKRLQGRRVAVQADAREAPNENTPGISRSRSGLFLSSKRNEEGRADDLPRSNVTGVQVPVSPTKRQRLDEATLQRSPSRVLLGIDKGLRAKSVSLKRAPSSDRSRASADPFQDPPGFAPRQAGQGRYESAEHRPGPSSGRSFAARMANARQRESAEQHRRERQAKLRESRSTNFKLDQAELDAFKQAAAPEQADHLTEKSSDRSFSREEVLGGVRMADRSSGHRSTQVIRTTSETRPRSRAESRLSHDEKLQDGEKDRETPVARAPRTVDGSFQATSESEHEPATCEQYSGCFLSRRVLPHTFIQRTVEGKKVARIPDLLKTVKGPEYLIPDDLLENDYVLFALVASKSAPIEHKKLAADKKTETMSSGAEAEKSLKNEHGNYMVLTLTDLKWTIDLFLFGPAFVRFRKLTPGTLIAILNPDIMPPPKHLSSTGRWSLKLTSAEETVLEIGTSKNLGWCKSVKKNGQLCGAWVDLLHTEFCEFHINLGVEKSRSGRMEVQGMSALFGPGGKTGSSGSKRGGFRDEKMGRFGGVSKSNESSSQFDRGSHSFVFVAGKASVEGQTAASLLDTDGFSIRGGSAARQRELLAAQEKESAIAESLGVQGSGAGAEYLRMRSSAKDFQAGQSTTSSVAKRQPMSAKSLGLADNKSSSILLSPLKRKRSGPGDEAHASTKKKTRFVTSKGIREAGRDSLNVYEAGSQNGGSLDEDDELDIV